MLHCHIQVLGLEIDESTSRPGSNRPQRVTWATPEIGGYLSYGSNESVPKKRAPAESFRVAGAETGRISSRKAFRQILQLQSLPISLD
eukprot:s60_g58.t1